MDSKNAIKSKAIVEFHEYILLSVCHWLISKQISRKHKPCSNNLFVAIFSQSFNVTSCLELPLPVFTNNFRDYFLHLDAGITSGGGRAKGLSGIIFVVSINSQ